MILIRRVEERDVGGLFELAGYLDSMNLPRERKMLRRLIHVSRASFGGRIKAKQQGKFLFVAEDVRRRKIIGCAAVFAQHGTPERPHIYFQMRHETRHSRFLGKSFRRKFLTLEKSGAGPTEMCALVVLPRYRRRPEQIGLQVAFARYLYLWRHPEKFKRRFLSELNGVIRPDGGNDLWDALGGKLTGLDYRTADHLSAASKEFILSLYPRTRFYVDLLPKKAQQVLEQPSPESAGALRLLEKIGFRYLKQCCPFDGGPHYGARWRDIKLFRHMREGKASPGDGKKMKTEGLVATEKGKKFRALRSFYHHRNGRFFIPQQTLNALGIRRGDPITVLELRR